MNHATAILMLKALDGLVARQIATAENIANAGSSNYRPLRVSFEDALKKAALVGEDAVRQVQIKAEAAPPDPEDAKVRLDRELATASMTALRYEALIDIFDRQTQMDSLATKGTS